MCILFVMTVNCGLVTLQMNIANQAAYTTHWITGPLPQKHLCLILDHCFDVDRETEIANKITDTQNSDVSFVFQQQNFADPRLMFCANVSHTIRKT